ncbi:MAG: ATP-binding protein [Oscillospiraceae bacterium]|jgi:DNA replication protein DnaC|nr:ATP-binding protein [Oscillospiraceae bacterium]
MGYGEQVFQKAKDILQQKRLAADTALESRRAQVVRECPEYLMLERELALTGQAVIKALDIKDPDEVAKYIKGLRKQNLELQAEIARLLKVAGHGSDYLEPRYTCAVCRDTGIADGKLCDCFRKLMKQLAYDALCADSPLKISGFEDFSLAYYPDKPDERTGISARRRMQEVLEFCQAYASDFSPGSPSLYLFGETGLGKTHLSLSIAGEVIEAGYSVVYGSTQNLIARIEDEHFGRRAADGDSTESKLIHCDLLILDDLGAEFCTQFTVSVIYNIINSRLLNSHPTIISSNLSLPELEAKYTTRVTSRILGEYRHLRFFGRDIRQIRE